MELRNVNYLQLQFITAAEDPLVCATVSYGALLWSLFLFSPNMSMKHNLLVVAFL